ncbi:MAG TPA: ATP-binding cassette domain-containing protein [Anaerolineae bacterium]|nr:ATP-binding cassette domain-containing protein [Anaerolineae bacterium]HQI87318.1 ATP-binding cassette domain-containing protein [Anaerolineae bacterium]
MTEQTPQSQLSSTSNSGKPLLEVKNLKMYFPIVKGIFGKISGYVKAADEVSFSIRSGETLGLVGESGCGKTTVGRCIVRAYKPTGGNIIYRRADETDVDLAKVDSKGLQAYRKDIRIIFQDPFSSLNPRMNVFEIISEVLRVNNLCSPKEMEYLVAQTMEQCGLRPEYMRRYPHAFSGGERQRIGIAHALVTSPRLVVCDEAVSGLDVSVRAQILNLMEDLRRDLNLTYLFISHDLSVIRHICDRVAVMYVGKLVELADANTLYTNPLHPYTESLMSAVPIPDPDLREYKNRIRLEGEVADPSNPPSGCYFHPRCRYAKDRCRTETPELRDLGNDHFVACHFADELELVGVRMA